MIRSRRSNPRRRGLNNFGFWSLLQLSNQLYHAQEKTLPRHVVGWLKSRASPFTDSKSVENLFGLGYKLIWKKLKERIAQRIVYHNIEAKDNIPFPP